MEALIHRLLGIKKVRLSGLINGAQRLVTSLQAMEASHRQEHASKVAQAQALHAEADELKKEADTAAGVAANLTTLFAGAVK